MNKEELVINQIKRIDFSGYVNYGEVTIKIRNGKATLLTKEETTKLD